MKPSRNYWLARLNGAEFKVMRLQETAGPEDSGDNPDSIMEFLRARIPQSLRYNSDTENFGVVFLSTRRKIIGWEIISNGTLDTLLVHPREVFKPAIIMSASAIIIFHNHPSGDPSPSEADIKITRELVAAGKMMRIEVLDHLVIGRTTPERPIDYSSLRELGYFYS